jgi:hypothetical protein
MISHRLDDDYTVTIRFGARTISAPIEDVVQLAYAIIEDLDPTGETVPKFKRQKPPQGAQSRWILSMLENGDYSSGALGRKINRSSSHISQQLLRMQRDGYVVSYPIPESKNRIKWRITPAGRRKLAIEKDGYDLTKYRG